MVGARADIDSALASASAEGDQRAVARALSVLGHVEQAEGSFDASSATLERATRIWRDVGDAQGEAEALSQLGMTRSLMGDPDAAETALRTALSAFRSLGSRREEAWALWNLAEISYGLVYLRGRASDQINVAGRKVAPETIERVLAVCPGIRESLVFGIPSQEPERGVALQHRQLRAADVRQLEVVVHRGDVVDAGLLGRRCQRREGRRDRGGAAPEAEADLVHSESHADLPLARGQPSGAVPGCSGDVAFVD